MKMIYSKLTACATILLLAFSLTSCDEDSVFDNTKTSDSGGGSGNMYKLTNFEFVHPNGTVEKRTITENDYVNFTSEHGEPVFYEFKNDNTISEYYPAEAIMQYEDAEEIIADGLILVSIGQRKYYRDDSPPTNDYVRTYTYTSSNGVINSIKQTYWEKFDDYYEETIWKSGQDVMIDTDGNWNRWTFSASQIMLEYWDGVSDKRYSTKDKVYKGTERFIYTRM